MSKRGEIVALAESFDGVSAKLDRERYLSLVAGPEDTGKSAQDYLCDPHTSGCALVVRGLWRLAGLDHPRLLASYRIGMAVADVVAIARGAGAWVDIDRELRTPEPGDAVLVGGPGGGGPEHVYTVVEANDDGSYCSIDGGQRDTFGQCIRRKHRQWSTDRNHVLWDQVQAGTDPGAGARRRVRGFVDVAKLFGEGADAP